MTARKARATAKEEADSFAALRNDSQGQGQRQRKKQISSLRCEMAARKARAMAKEEADSLGE